MEVGCRSDVGKRKSVNEDSCGVWFSTIEGEERGIFVVADGVGGEDRGEVASRMAVSSIINRIHPLISKKETPDDESLMEHIDDAVREANKSIISYSRENNSSKMATTVTMAVMTGQDVIMANVGDSRTYICRDGSLEKITKDHSLLQSLVEQGKLSPEEIKPPRSDKAKMQENVVTKVLGNKEEVEPDLYADRLVDGDQLMLCCDGVTDLVLESKIEDTMSTIDSPEEACSSLVDSANEEGGKDNITVVIAKPSDLPAGERIMERQTIVKRD